MMKNVTCAATSLAILLGTVAPVAADWREDFGSFNIGILSGENEADRIRRNDCLQDLLAEKLSVPVELYPAADYAGVMQGLLAGQLHMAGMGPSGYAGVYLADADAVEPFVVDKNIDDSLGYYAVIYVRSDSDAQTLEDLEGMSLAYADPNSTSGYLVPRAELRAAGIDDEEFFGSTGFAGGHEQGVIAVLQGQYDAGVTWSSLMGDVSEGYSRGNLRRMVDNDLLDMDDIRIVWESGLIPNGPRVRRTDLPQEAKDIIDDLYATFEVDYPECYRSVVGGEGNGYAPVDHSFYATMVEMRREELEGSR